MPARIFSLALILILAASARAADPAPLPGTQPLTLEGDIASQLVDGVDRFLLREIDKAAENREKLWKRDTSSAEAYNKSIEPNRQRLAHILGLRDPRPPFETPEYISGPGKPALVGKGEGFEVYAIRWPAVAHQHRPVAGTKWPLTTTIYGEGLLLVPTGREPIADVVAIPHCDQTPEQIVGLVEGVAPESQYARRLAESGCRVIVPMLINRKEFVGGITHREFLYRSAFDLGRHLIGYELQKVLAAVDWFEKSGNKRKIGVIGYGDGGMLALYAAAVDPRIGGACVSGYFGDRKSIWRQPIDRNVFGLLERFGDAELAALIAPRYLVVETSRVPSAEIAGGRGAPASIVTISQDEVKAEIASLGSLIGTIRPKAGSIVSTATDLGSFGTQHALHFFFISALADYDHNPPIVHKLKPLGTTPESLQKSPDPAARHARQFDEIDRHNQTILAESQHVRQANFWDKLDYSSIENYAKSIEPFRTQFREEVIGKFDQPLLPANPRTRKVEENDKWTRYEVVLDVFPDVIAYGLLTLPKDIKEGEKRPVVVCQHGLEGRPQDVIGESKKEYYAAFATALAERGFVTFAPQNLYIFTDRFRTLQRKANPLGKTLFSIIVPQHQQIVDWLQTQPFVDPARIGFYGLSYGGKSAMRIPPLVTDYALSICSADFNEWVDKNASTHGTYSYVWTNEYEIFEWDLGSTFNYAEMAGLIAPRPFMVERGHFDGVGLDQNVAWEYGKVRHLYAARLKAPHLTEIEWFDGPHSINGVGTYKFLHKHLNWPEPKP